MHQTVPRIIMTSKDHARVSALASSVADRLPQVSEYLEWEADRAEVVDPLRVPAKVVTMNSRAEILDLVGGTRRVVTLVYPEDEDAAADRVSILSPLGAALIGVFEGFSIDYPTPGGRTGTVKIVKVYFQPEANGQYDR